MGIKVENLQAIERAVTARLEKLRPEFITAVGVEKERIQSRTQSGVDVDGKTFRYYQPLTIKNRQAKGKQVRHVDLTFDGDMFRAFRILITQTQSAITALLTFGAESWKVRKNEAYGRKFFGLSKEQIEIIKTKLRNAK